MIRRDYILRIIEEFFQALSRIKALKQGEKWEAATAAMDEEFNRLVGAGAQAVAQLNETELLAKVVQGEPTSVVRHKILLLTTLLNEAGDVAAAQGRVEESRGCYLKALHLLLDALTSNEVEVCPEFVPKVELLVEALGDSPLPMRTYALLMHHYERTGQFAKAEDAFYHLLEGKPDSREIMDFGISFYERLQNQSNSALEEGNLPRAELEAGLAELGQRKMALSGT
jgi:tetratricopeptide (TPR) repeat protein